MVHLSMTNVPHDIEWLSDSHANTTITIILIWISKEMNIYDNYGAQSNKLIKTFRKLVLRSVSLLNCNSWNVF